MALMRTARLAIISLVLFALPTPAQQLPVRRGSPDQPLALKLLAA